ncbi:MAG: DUF5615 family PIN-like protein [Candidatus Sumerlaeota bacterium]|nr:DUF5615 family PIN-like protein [Candidatus Sumerlaeota bacterium]
MNFLCDHDVYAATSQFLAGLGHDVVRAAEIGLARAKDEELLLASQSRNRILVTRDRGFGALVFVKRMGAGVLYLRMKPSEQEAAHNVIQQVLTCYSADELAGVFIVIEADGYRVRQIPKS